MAAEARKPLLDFLENMADHEIGTLFDTLTVAHDVLIYESSEESWLMDQFMTSLWIAARGERLNFTTKDD